MSSKSLFDYLFEPYICLLAAYLTSYICVIIITNNISEVEFNLLAAQATLDITFDFSFWLISYIQI